MEAGGADGLNETQMLAIDALKSGVISALIVRGVSPVTMLADAPENSSSPLARTASKTSVRPVHAATAVALEYPRRAAAATPPVVVSVLNVGSLTAAFVVASNVVASLSVHSAQKPAKH